MIQKVLTKYVLVFHTAFVVIFSFLYLVHARVFGLVPLLWLSLISVELMVLLPSVRLGETLVDARRRALSACVWDPFLYIGMMLVGVVLVQWCNSGCELIYLADADIWQFSPPPVAAVPFSVEARASLTYVSVFTACVVMGVVLRSSVSRMGKRLLLQGLAGVSGVVAVHAIWQACSGTELYVARTLEKGGASMGTFFGFWMLIGMGVIAEALARGQRGIRPLFVFGVCCNLLGMLFFASALAVCVYSSLMILLFVYWLVYLSPHVGKHVQLKLFLASVAVVACVSLSLLFVFPKNPVVEKFKEALPVATYWDSVTAVNSMRTAVALEIWQSHPWMGVGADGFYHFAALTAAHKGWALRKTDPACVYNDSLQFLCEFGVFGAGFLLAAVITLIVPICYRLRVLWKSGSGNVDDGRPFVLRMSPIVVTGVLAAGICCLESWIASPFRSYSVLLSWTCVMAVLPAFLPACAPETRRT